jgi:hypothetical protein
MEGLLVTLLKWLKPVLGVLQGKTKIIIETSFNSYKLSLFLYHIDLILKLQKPIHEVTSSQYSSYIVIILSSFCLSCIMFYRDLCHPKCDVTFKIIIEI